MCKSEGKSEPSIISAEDSILEAGLPDIPMSWVHIPFAEKMRFSEGGMARMVTPESLPFNFSTTPALEMEVGAKKEFGIVANMIWGLRIGPGGTAEGYAMNTLSTFCILGLSSWSCNIHLWLHYKSSSRALRATFFLSPGNQMQKVKLVAQVKAET